NLEQTGRDGFELTARLDHGVFSPLRFEMIFCFVKSNASPLLDVPQHFARKIDMPVQTGADRSASKRKLAQNFDRFSRAVFSVSDLLSVAGKFLTQPDRCRFLQLSPAVLDNFPKFFCLRIRWPCNFPYP